MQYPIRYWNHMRNIGDSINPNIIQHITGKQPFFCMNDQTEHAIAIGSIFFMATSKSHIWGSGIMNPQQDLSAVNPSYVHAVRGELTRDLLRKAFPRISDVPLGDPGIFIDEIVKRDPKSGSTGIIVMPNHRFLHHEYFRQLGSNDGVTVLDPTTDNLDVITMIMNAEMVISQSLHGLIFAEVYGVPAVWISHTQDALWNFKFHDWYSTTLEPVTDPEVFWTPLSSLTKKARLSGISIDRDRLRKSVPSITSSFPIKVSFNEVRSRSPFIFPVQKNATHMVRFNYDKILHTEHGNDLMIRDLLHDFFNGYPESSHSILIFDEELFLAMTENDIYELRHILDINHDIKFVNYLRNEDRSDILLPIHINEDSRINIAEQWTPSHYWKGVVLLRNHYNFKLDDQGVAVFSRPNN